VKKGAVKEVEEVEEEKEPMTLGATVTPSEHSTTTSS